MHAHLGRKLEPMRWCVPTAAAAAAAAVQTSIPLTRMPRPVVMLSSDVDDGDEQQPGASTNWDAAWRRQVLEGLPAAEGADSREESEEVQQAKAAVWRAEANVLSARVQQQQARDEVARAKAELERLERDKTKLPYEFEEIDELYRRIFEQPPARALQMGVGGLALALSLHAWSEGGAQGVVGCAFMPVVCVMNAGLDVLDGVS